MNAIATRRSNSGNRRLIAIGVGVAVVYVVAAKLGNTKAVYRKCYIHPEILAAYLDGLTIAYGTGSSTKPAKSAGKLHADELAVVALLKSRASKSARLSAVTK